MAFFELDTDHWHPDAAPAFPFLDPRRHQPVSPTFHQRQPVASFHPYPHFQQPPQPRYMPAPDDFGDTYTGQYDKMYPEFASTARAPASAVPAFLEPRRHSAPFYDSPRYPAASPAYPSPPPPHPQLQHLQQVQIPLFPAAHGPRSASSSSSSTSSLATSASSSSATSATSNASSYVPGPPDMMATSGAMCIPDLSLAIGMEVDMDMGVDALDMDMGMAMGMEMGYLQQQPQHPPSAPQPMTSISPQMELAIHHQLHQQQQQASQHHILYDDGYGGYATGDSDSYGQQLLQQQHQQLQEMHQQQIQIEMQQQQHLMGSLEPAVVQEWQKEGREYDSADSDSDSEQQRAMVVGLAVANAQRPGRTRTKKEASTSPASGEHQQGPDILFAASANGPKPASSDFGLDSDSGESEDEVTYPMISQNNNFEEGKISKRASTRTITVAKTASGKGKGGARARASTQTLTQKNAAGDAEGEMDAEGEDDMGEGSESMDADADGEDENTGEQGSLVVEEDHDEDEMSEESSYDYDDEKDGEFVLRSRSSRPPARPAVRRAGEDAAKRSGGRSLRARNTAAGSLTARYNPYSLYAASATAAAAASDGLVISLGTGSPTTATTHSSVIASSIPGLRTLSASLAINTNFSSLDHGFNSPVSPTLSTHSSAHSQITMSSSSSGTSSSGLQGRKARQTANLPVPVPVPNLTKKSRGRRVPTVSSLEELRKATGMSQDVATGGGRGGRKARGSAGTSSTKGTRMYLCDVEGCGKCFARGEHLKRHVRSIHTNEKPHPCLFPGCGKEFSRHDNLGQHMRVHKDFVPPPSVKA